MFLLRMNKIMKISKDNKDKVPVYLLVLLFQNQGSKLLLNKVKMAHSLKTVKNPLPIIFLLTRILW